MLFFFFSSRRRHTRFSRDWSSDVCSSDLPRDGTVLGVRPLAAPCGPGRGGALVARAARRPRGGCTCDRDRVLACLHRGGGRDDRAHAVLASTCAAACPSGGSQALAATARSPGWSDAEVISGSHLVVMARVSYKARFAAAGR